MTVELPGKYPDLTDEIQACHATVPLAADSADLFPDNLAHPRSFTDSLQQFVNAYTEWPGFIDFIVDSFDMPYTREWNR